MATPPLPARILVVDDDRGLLRLIEKALRREGYATWSAASGADALVALKHARPDLMLLDLKLADMPGLKLVELAAEAGCRAPFLVITGQGDEKVAVEMMKRGALDYMVKDGQFLELLSTVVGRVVQQIERDRKLAAAEEQLRLIQAAVQQAKDAVLITTAEVPEPRIVYANLSFKGLTGLTPDEVVGKGFGVLRAVMPEFDRFDRAFANGQPLLGEGTVEPAGGSKRIVGWQLTPVRDQAGQISHWVSIQRDVTERRRLEAEILEISGREQQRIGQDLHDGLGQHLAGIELMSRVLEQKLAEKSKAAAAEVATISKHVREAISQTRALARGLSPVAADPNGLMAALQDMASNTASLYRVRCELRCPEPVLVADAAPANHLFRIAQEAMNNALKHAQAGQITLSLTEQAGLVTLKVEDDGSGLPSPMPSTGGMGLRIMGFRARAIGATLEISRRQPRGTAVVCSWRIPK